LKAHQQVLIIASSARVSPTIAGCRLHIPHFAKVLQVLFLQGYARDKAGMDYCYIGAAACSRACPAGADVVAVDMHCTLSAAQAPNILQAQTLHKLSPRRLAHNMPD